MGRRFKFTMDLFKNLDPYDRRSSPSMPPAHNALVNTPPPREEESSGKPMDFLNAQLSTPPLTNVSPNYTYDQQNNDYFRYKSKHAQPHLNTNSPIVDRSPKAQKLNKSHELGENGNEYLDDLESEQEQIVSPIEEDQSSTCSLSGRRGSIVPSSAPTSTNTPVSDDKSYIPSTHSYKFMCVDDNKINLRILSKLIGKLYPYADIHITTNPIQALTMIEENDYDLCFIDIEMPGLTGKEIAFKVRQTDQILGLIAVTTKASPDEVLEYESLGIDSTFAKPLQYSYTHIMDSVDTVIEKRKQQELKSTST
ncbi:stress response regulator protein 1 [[Candida] railenensis]|uniref:Stress response regulator protein 1 n=1 Tax=[Candida] railenensis TaxID=45579 RepID=A0A9P0VZT6_9ASCO|nr:stress response regulator protein 1 [[Candida] railenensis]